MSARSQAVQDALAGIVRCPNCNEPGERSFPHHSFLAQIKDVYRCLTPLKRCVVLHFTADKIYVEPVASTYHARGPWMTLEDFRLAGFGITPQWDRSLGDDF